jgi:hypothetical protein
MSSTPVVQSQRVTLWSEGVCFAILQEHGSRVIRISMLRQSLWFQWEFVKIKYETKFAPHAKLLWFTKTSHMDIDFYWENINRVPAHNLKYYAQFPMFVVVEWNDGADARVTSLPLPQKCTSKRHHSLVRGTRGGKSETSGGCWETLKCRSVE